MVVDEEGSETGVVVTWDIARVGTIPIALLFVVEILLEEMSVVLV
jgi:hypothetical protein